MINMYFCDKINNYLHNLVTVDLVFFACLNFCEFLILGLITKFRICEFSLFFSSAIIIIIFARFLNSRKLKPHKYNQIYSIRIKPNIFANVVYKPF